MSFSPVKKSAFYHQQLAIGAHMVERDGWLQPAYYSGAKQETRSLTESAGVFDVSPLGNLLLQGDALDDLLRTTIGSGNAPAVAEVRHVAPPAYGRLARLTADECLLICGPGELPTWDIITERSLDDCVHFRPHFRSGRSQAHRAQIVRPFEQALGVRHVARLLPKPRLRPG